MTLAEQLRQEGRQEGGAEEAQRAVMEVLEARFGHVPEGLVEEVRHEKRLAKLRALHRAGIVCASLEAFAASLGE